MTTDHGQDAHATGVRLRFAPSPTGLLHVGGVRTALFNWLLARHCGGCLLLRIEDTDRDRYQPQAEQDILDSLRWLALDWDEGPYRQSERAPIYREHASRLVEQGLAYPCFCSPQRLEEMRRQQQARQQPPGYDRRCRGLSSSERARLAADGITPVIRFAMPLEGETRFQDLVRGEIVFENRLLDDFVLLKSDGFPTYHLANAVDDHLMEISHVLRGEEWISSTPRHLQLYRALGFAPPQYAHLPLLLGADRSKLSKRHGATSVAAYREQGYLPEALVNFLALLGWSPGEDRELFTREELVERFTLEGVGRSPAVFDPEKLAWMNGHYIRSCSLDRLVELALPHLRQAGLVPEEPTDQQQDYLRRVLALEHERIKLLSEIPYLVEFFLKDQIEIDPAAAKKWLQQDYVPDALTRLADRLEALPEWTHPAIESALRSLAEEMNLPAAKLIHPARAAVTGRTAGPGLFETMETLGRERVLARLKRPR